MKSIVTTLEYYRGRTTDDYTMRRGGYPLMIVFSSRPKGLFSSEDLPWEIRANVSSHLHSGPSRGSPKLAANSLVIRECNVDRDRKLLRDLRWYSSVDQLPAESRNLRSTSRDDCPDLLLRAVAAMDRSLSIGQAEIVALSARRSGGCAVGRTTSSLEQPRLAVRGALCPKSLAPLRIPPLTPLRRRH